MNANLDHLRLGRVWDVSHFGHLDSNYKLTIDGQLGTRGGQSTGDWAYRRGSGDGGSHGSAGSDGNTMVIRVQRIQA